VTSAVMLIQAMRTPNIMILTSESAGDIQMI
jgi:hypothetical protein